MSRRERHIPVLFNEVLEITAPMDGERVVDATFGAGGYARGFLEAAGVEVLGIDRDPTAVAAATPLMASYKDRLRVVQGRFSAMADLVNWAGWEDVQLVVMDVGLSSMHVDEAERGFSFMKDGPLDMRMGLSGASAADILATWDVGDLRHLFRRLGEEPRAGRIARAIGEIRTTKPLTRTRELAQLVERVAGEGGAGRIHPATRVFQALRMAVNEELEELEAGLEAAEQILSAGGRLAVVSFHSLEDRIVKRFLQSRSGADAGPSRHAPEPPQGREPTFERLTKKPITPGEAECRHNPRARSARLRAARRTSAKSWPKLSEKLAA